MHSPFKGESQQIINEEYQLTPVSRIAFQKWKACQRQHVEETSLLENHLLVKREGYSSPSCLRIITDLFVVKILSAELSIDGWLRSVPWNIDDRLISVRRLYFVAQ